MGIQGLLSVLKPITKHVHISEFSGKTVGIDAYCWLHKAAFSCAQELCLGVPTTKHVKFCMDMVKLLQFHNITPYLVFDGANLPSKRNREQERKERREIGLAKARKFLSEGNNAMAVKGFQQAIDISPLIAKDFVEELKKRNIQFVISPYESDAQLAFLVRNNIIDAVITEDSDLIPYDSPCTIFKLAKDGSAQCIFRENLQQSLFSNFTDSMILDACILSGCDYLDSLDGVGLKTAVKLLKKYHNIDRVLNMLNRELQITVSHEYEQKFRKAKLTFLHQQVYDPINRRVRTLTDIPSELEHDEEFRQLLTELIGPPIPDDIGCAIAECSIDPTTLSPFPQSKNASILQNNGTRCGAKPLVIKKQAKMDSFFRASSISPKVVKEKPPHHSLVSNAARKPFKTPTRVVNHSSQENNGENLNTYVENNVVTKSRFFNSMTSKGNTLPPMRDPCYLPYSQTHSYIHTQNTENNSVSEISSDTQDDDWSSNTSLVSTKSSSPSLSYHCSWSAPTRITLGLKRRRNSGSSFNTLGEESVAKQGKIGPEENHMKSTEDSVESIEENSLDDFAFSKFSHVL